MLNLIDLRQIDLNLLVVFAAVFRERSVKRAAGRLFVGQSAVSMALGRLRVLFGDELFVKVAGGVEPTSRAVTLEPRVRHVLELVHEAVFEPGAFDPSKASRVFRVALADDLEVWLLPRLLDDLRRTAPGITVVVRASDWYTGVTRVEAGDAEVALGVLPEPGPSMKSEVLFQQRFASIFDPNVVSPPLSLAKFLATPHVMLSAAGDLVGLVDEALRVRGKARRLIGTVPGFAALAPLVKGRALIATLPQAAARALAEPYGLAVATPPVTLKRYPVSMVWHGKTERDPASGWLRDRLRRAARGG